MIAALIARDPAPLPEAVAATMRRLEGAYSVVALVDGTLVTFRDPHGIRPLTLGRIGDDWVVASESCALDLIGADRRPRRAPRRGALARRRRAPQRPGAARGPRRGLHLRARLLRAARLAPRRQRDPREPRADGAAARRGGTGRRRPRDADPRLRHAGGDRLRQGVRDPLRGGPDQEPLRRPHVHPARPGAAAAGDQAQVQPARRDRRAGAS